MSLQFIDVFNKKRVWAMKNKFLLLNNVNSILDLFKILTYYIDDKKILEIRNKNKNKDNIFSILFKTKFGFLPIFVVNVNWMTIMKDIQQGESWKYKMKPSFDGVCKCQKWVKNANQTQLKPIMIFF